MRLANPFSDFGIAELFETLLPDFVLAFAFFTFLIYAVLSRRFGHQRPAVAMYAVLGLSLASGLVWLEYDRGWSIRNLGPVALGFAVILLGMIMYQAIRQVGGSWAGAGIAIGASLLVAWFLGFDWPIAPRIVHTVMFVGLAVGIVAFLIHSRGRAGRVAHLAPAVARAEVGNVRHDMSDLYKDRRVGTWLKHGLRRLRHEADDLPERPDGATDVMRQLNRMLPAEGWLTERLRRLRVKARYIRKGHIARIDELRHVTGKLPGAAGKRASHELRARYREVRLDTRLERLEKAVAEYERRIKVLTREARGALVRSDYHKLTDLLKAAAKLQKHNSGLLKIIERTERKLGRTAKHIAGEARR